MATASQDQVIDLDAVETLPRGRKATFDQDLLDLFASVPKGKAIAVGSRKVNPADAEARGKVRSILVKHWEQARGTKGTVRFSTEGVPQVFDKR